MIKKYSVEKIRRSVKTKGFCVVENILTKSFCNKTIVKLEKILSNLHKKKSYFGSSTNQIIYNYFYHDLNLLKLTHLKIINSVMTSLIDENYVLISPAARNPRIKQGLKKSKKTSGSGWHTDSRVGDPIKNLLFKPSMNYYAIIALENFGGQNSTEYVPKSHLRYKKPLNRFVERQHKKMKCKAGSIIFFDSGLWHQVGKPSTNSRWSIFNMYGPWFMKPYFNFAYGLKKNQIKKLNKVQRKILHFDSIPPKNSEGRIATLKPAKKVDYKKLYL
jgi:ectoine hydroxylase-related dioxygenase (phytanoyl-CoA dioxygenase family)